MDKNEKYKTETLERIRSINTLEEFEKSREEILTMMEKVLKSSVEALGDFIKNMFSMDPEERQEKSQKLQDENYLLGPEIMQEVDNLSRIPGIEKHTDSFTEELEKRLGPFFEEYAETLGKHMDKFMGTMVNEMAESFGGPLQEDEPVEEEFYFDDDNPDTPVMLYNLYAARSVDELKDNLEGMLEQIEEDLQSDIWDLEVLSTLETDQIMDQDKKKVSKIRHQSEILVREIEKELSRIASRSDSEKETEEIKNEIMNRISQKLSEIKGYLDVIKWS